MNKDELKAIYFSFYEQLKSEHAEKAKANYDEDYWTKEPKDHDDAVSGGFDWFSSPEGDEFWLDVHGQLEAKTYPLQLTPQVCKDKAVDFMSTERMATKEDHIKLEEVVKSIKAETINEAPPTEPNFGTDASATLTTDPEERKNTPVYSGCVNYFPLALAAVSRLSKKGNDQHNPGTPLHWDRSKSGDELDAMMRHVIDGDWDAVAWRALAHLQKVEEERLSK